MFSSKNLKHFLQYFDTSWQQATMVMKMRDADVTIRRCRRFDATIRRLDCNRNVRRICRNREVGSA
jgi:hypothetical protein